MRPPVPTPLVAVVVCAALACSGEPARHPVGAACTADKQCGSGVCFQATCSKPCASAAACNGGLCVDKVCVAADKVRCGGDDVCEEVMPAAGPCQLNRCQGQFCRLLPKADATACGDSKCDPPKQCTGGVCAPAAGATAPNCDDGNVCTHDTCSPSTGCAAIPNTLACDDGKFCTAGEACAGGACKGGKPVGCGEATACAIALCSESAKGCTTTKPSGGPCDDGDPCTSGDTCQGGVCGAGKIAACNDANPCTVDACGAGGACAFAQVENGTGCGDGDPCTVADQCEAGQCAAGAPMVCDDENACTQDKCAAGKCTFVNAGPEVACDDGDPCTGWGQCDNAKCKKGELGVWSLVKPGVANTPNSAVALDIRGGVVHVFGTESSGGKFEIAHYQMSPDGGALKAANFSDAEYGLAATDAEWMPVAGTSGVHVVVGTASKAGSALAAFAVGFALDGKVALKLTVVPDTFANPGKTVHWRAVDVHSPHVWAAGDYGAPELPKPVVARLGADLTVAMLTVLDELAQGADLFEVRDVAADPDGSGAIVVGRVTNGFKQTSYVRRVTLALQPDWKAPPVANTAWHAIARKADHWVLVGSKLLPSGITAIASAELHGNGGWLWQQAHPIGVQAAAHAVAVAASGDLYYAGWSISDLDKLAAPLLGRLSPFGAPLEHSVLPTSDKGRLDAIALSESATQVVAVGVHGPNDPNVGPVVVAANAFAQLICAQAGACTGLAASACDDGKPCTLDSCTQGKCTNAPFSDGAPCGATAVCAAGACAP